MPDLGEGAVFAGHRIDGVAGRGGMGTVYRATHIALDHMVALKVIAADLADDDSFRERFKSESRIAVSLRHPNVVPIHHAGEEQGLLFVTMDLIDGPDLRKLLLARGPLEPAEAISILEQVASALDVAHSRGLVHRDIKPGNILIESRAGAEHVYLTDFGLTKRMDQATEVSALTSTGAFVGTLDYVAPEQIRGERLDARTDVYALGCVLYEMLAGRTPFGDREEKVAKMYGHLQDVPSSAGGAARGARRRRQQGDLEAARRPLPLGGRPRPRRLGGERRRPGGRGRAQRRHRTRCPDDGLRGPDRAGAGAGVRAAAAARGEGGGGAPARAGADRRERTAEPHTSGGGRAGPAPGQPSRSPPRRLLAPAVRALRCWPASPSSSPRASPRRCSSPAGTVARRAPRRPSARCCRLPTRFRAASSRSGWPSPGTASTSPTAMGGSCWSATRSTFESRDQVDLPGSPEDVIVSDGSVWVTVPDAGKVVRAPTSDVTELTEIAVGVKPSGIAAGEGSIWVTNFGSGNVSRIDPQSNGVETVPIDAQSPHGIAVADGVLWITDRSAGRLIRHEIAGGAADTTIRVGENPKGVAVAGGVVWVANADSESVSLIDEANSKAIDRRVEVGGQPRAVEVLAGKVWVSNGDVESKALDEKRGWVSAFDADSREAEGQVGVGGSPEGLGVGSGKVWVATGPDGVVRAIEPG